MRLVIRILGCVVVAAVLGACREEISPPRERPNAQSSSGALAVCDTGCSLLSTTEAWDLPDVAPDSASAWMPVASVVVSANNKAPGVISLLLGSGLSQDALNLPLRIGGPLNPITVRLGQLVAGLAVPLTTGGEALRVNISVPRTSKFKGLESFNLVMVSEAKVISLYAPRGKARSRPFFTPPPASCALVTQTAVCGGVADTINPYAPGILGSFQSNSGSGVSSPITITFSPSVNSVTIEIEDPTYAGNTIKAYNGTALIATGSYTYSGTPGVNQPNSIKLTGTISKVVLTPAPLDYVAYAGGFESASSQVTVTCSPGTLVRADTVSCMTTLNPARAFTVTRRMARGVGFTLEDTTQIVHALGDTNVWKGPAIASSSVVVEVAVITPIGDTAKISNTTPATFTVSRRTFAAWSLVYTGGFGGGAPQFIVDSAEGFASYPLNGRRWGVMQIEWPSFDDPATQPTLSPTTGPNVSLRTLKNAIALGGYTPYVHAGLDLAAATARVAANPADSVPLHFYHDQNGTNGTCLAADIVAFRDRVIRHEGGTGASNSHFGIANTQFPILKPDSIFESFYSTDSDVIFRKFLNNRMTRFSSDTTQPYRIAQRGFDASDAQFVYPHLLATGACVIDVNYFNP